MSSVLKSWVIEVLEEISLFEKAKFFFPMGFKNENDF